MVYSKYKGKKRARSSSKSHYKKKYKTRYAKKYKKRATYGWSGAYAAAKSAIVASAEKKYKDTSYQLTNCAAGGVLTFVSGVTQGADYYQRIGRKIRITSIQLEAAILPQFEGEPDRCRVLVVWDKQPNGAALPPVTNILTDQGGGATSYSFMNLDWRERFQVLMEETFTLGFVRTTGDPAYYPYSVSPAVANISRYKEVDLTVEFQGTDNTLGSVSTGAIYVLTIGSRSGGTCLRCSWNFRMRFTDL